MKAIKFATIIDEKVLKELKIFAKETERSLSKIVTEAIDEYLKKSRVRPAFKSAVEETLSENEELLKRLAK